LILLAWAAGLALVAGAIGWERIVGVGFTWLAAGVSALIGLAGALADDAWWARAGLVLVLLSAVLAKNRAISSLALLTGGALFLVQGSLLAGWVPAVVATVALGGVTGEMLLGHWYLVDPRLPRSALTRLAEVGIVGLVLEGLLEAWLEIGLSGGAIAFWVLLGTSVVLMGAVIAALRYPAYSGVMAATGLSYLAVLTTLGSVFVGRAVSAGLGPFAFG
jgi:hypothetical protein